MMGKIVNIEGGGLSLPFDTATKSFGKFTGGWGEALELPLTFYSDREKCVLAKTTEIISASDSEVKLLHMFAGANMKITEIWNAETDCIRWRAEAMTSDKRTNSCRIEFHIPEQRAEPCRTTMMWAPYQGMPNGGSLPVYRFDYPVTIKLPAFALYRPCINEGIFISVPFDFKHPESYFSWGNNSNKAIIGFNLLRLDAEHIAKAELMFRKAPGCYRPGLGWLYEKYKEYFEPRSITASRLNGGHRTIGKYPVDKEEAEKSAVLGCSWAEIHRHFPEYGNYVPDTGIWKAVDTHDDTPVVTKELIEESIRTLHGCNIMALPYFQVSGDASPSVKEKFADSTVHTLQGEIYDTHFDMFQMNSDPKYSFGREIAQQMRKLIERYPEADGLFIDQACYNWLDLAHDDGMTAYSNAPAYMTIRNYLPHLEKLSEKLHPEKVIIGNGVKSVEMLKYFDAVMAEGNEWSLENMKYYSLGTKVVFLLMYETDPANLENMMISVLLNGACFTSYPAAYPHKKIYEVYMPLIEKLYGRKWIFDPAPVELNNFRYGIFRGRTGSILLPAAGPSGVSFDRDYKVPCKVSTSDIGSTCSITIYYPGGKTFKPDFAIEKGTLSFMVPCFEKVFLAEIVTDNV